MVTGTAVTEQPLQHNFIRVFISYSWKNTILRDALTDILKNHGLEPVYDQSFVPVGDQLNDGILMLLDSADAVVTLITDESIGSIAIREELARAHAQYKRIYPIVQETVVNQLPWFLQSPRRLQFVDDQDLLKKFSELAYSIRRDSDFIERSKPHKSIRKLHQVLHRITKKSAMAQDDDEFRAGLFEAVVERVKDEAEALDRRRFESEIGEGASFLRMAKPVFQSSTDVWAVSVDRISKFWVSDNVKDQRLARQYIWIQPEKTRRLFVFSDPDEAHRYVHMLNIHSRQYGDEGRVFLCSWDSYEKIVREVAEAPMQEDLLNSDFAVLQYSDQAQPMPYLARLANGSFTVEPFSGALKRQFEVDRFQEIFRELHRLRAGDISSTWGVMRWEVDIQLDTDTWSNRLERLFQERSRDVMHLVFFSNEINDKEFHDNLTEVKRKLDEIKSEERPNLLFTDIWYGEAQQMFVFDAKYKGQLKTDECQMFPRILVMRFKDVASLKTWYELEEHSDIRRKVYEKLDPKIVDLYRTLDALMSNMNPQDDFVGTLEATYFQVEDLAFKYMRRRDYRDGLGINDLVETRAFRPKIRFDRLNL